jgi:prevent-host-death family protein
MKIIPLAEAKARLSAVLDEAGAGPIVITRNGRPAAVLIAPDDDDDLERLLLSRSPRFRALLERSRHSARAGHGMTEDEFWSAVDVSVAAPPGKTQPAGAV